MRLLPLPRSPPKRRLLYGNGVEPLQPPIKALLYEEPPQNFSPAFFVSACYIEIEGELLLLKRTGIRPETGRWGVPAGKLEAGETPKEAALRELFEETKIALEHPFQLFPAGVLYIRKPDVDFVYYPFKVHLDAKPHVRLSEESSAYCWASAHKRRQLPLLAAGPRAIEYLYARTPLFNKHIETPLGPMLAVADAQVLYALEFLDHPLLDKKRARFQKLRPFSFVEGTPSPIALLQSALAEYFATGKISAELPLALWGPPFQREVWQALRQLSWGERVSYLQLAQRLGKPKAVRAVAQACGANPFPIVIPCHRIVQSDGSLGGYSGGVARKAWLLNYESMSLSRQAPDKMRA